MLPFQSSQEGKGIAEHPSPRLGFPGVGAGLSAASERGERHVAASYNKVAAVFTVSPRHETPQIPALRLKKRFIYKPIGVFAGNCECQILQCADKAQRAWRG